MSSSQPLEASAQPSSDGETIATEGHWQECEPRSLAF